MTQRVAYYQVLATARPAEFYAWKSRRDMVADVTRLLDWHAFPQRARRQVDLVQAWRCVQLGGDASFEVRGNMGLRVDLSFRHLDADAWLSLVDM